MKLHDWHIRLTRDVWLRHPGVRADHELSFGERSADRLRNGMGSWLFVFSAIIFLFGWMLANRNVGFDPYPFILLNLILSCVAAMQGAILLIAARRSDQIAAELATSDYQTNLDAVNRIKALEAMISDIHAVVAVTGTAPTGGTE